MSKEDRGHPHVFVPDKNTLNAQDNFAFERMAKRAKSRQRLGGDAPPASTSGGWATLALVGLGVAAIVALSRTDDDGRDPDEPDEPAEPEDLAGPAYRSNPAPAPQLAAPVMGTFAMLMPMMVAAPVVTNVQPAVPEKKE